MVYVVAVTSLVVNNSKLFLLIGLYLGGMGIMPLIVYLY